MNDYRLTRDAEHDLLDVFLRGFETFGLAQAEEYRDGLVRCFRLLARHGSMGRKADELAPGARRHEHGRHVIFYDEQSYGVLITAIVHERNLRKLRT